MLDRLRSSPAIDPRSPRLRRPRPRWDERPPRAQRMVVVDLGKSSGLNLQRDPAPGDRRGGDRDGAIDLSQQFECTLVPARHRAGASTPIHGIAPSAVAAGRDPAEALSLASAGVQSTTAWLLAFLTATVDRHVPRGAAPALVNAPATACADPSSTSPWPHPLRSARTRRPQRPGRVAGGSYRLPGWPGSPRQRRCLAHGRAGADPCSAKRARQWPGRTARLHCSARRRAGNAD